MFIGKTLEERLQGDDDILFCWLRAVELALTAYGKLQAKAATNATRFFQPFREMGRKKLAAHRLAQALSKQMEVQEVPAGGRGVLISGEVYSQWEEEQISSEC